MENEDLDVLAEANTILVVSEISLDVLAGCVNACQSAQDIVMGDWKAMRVEALLSENITGGDVGIMDSTYRRIERILISMEDSYTAMYEIKQQLLADEID